jgi:hypothetical protein
MPSPKLIPQVDYQQQDTHQNQGQTDPGGDLQ